MESKNNWKAWLYLSPVLVLMAVFTFYPIINTIGISFLKNYNTLTGANDGFTFDNYLEILMLKPSFETAGGFVIYDEVFLKEALPNTLLITFVTVPLSIFLALAIAIVLNSIKFLKKIFQTIFFMPYVTNATAIGMVFSVLFDNHGLINFIFNSNVKWLFPENGVLPNYWTAFFVLCVYIVWHSLPYKILIFVGGLQNIDGQYYDAAKIDGASRFKMVRKVTVPLLSPQILYIFITSLIGGFKEYTSVVALFGTTGGQFQGGFGTMKTVAYYIYDYIDNPTGLQFAAAGAVLLLIIIMFFTALQKIVSKKRVHY